MELIFLAVVLIIVVVCIAIRWSYLRDEGYEGLLFWRIFLDDIPIWLINRVKERDQGQYYAPSGKKSGSKNAVDMDSFPSYYGCNYDPAAHGITVTPEDDEHDADLLNNGGWRCACGRVHASYVSSCSCGRNKHGELPAEPATVVKNDAPEDAEVRNARAIREYKGLMDDGIITAEEFEAKKKQLLGI
jgi:hypothetical protein